MTATYELSVTRLIAAPPETVYRAWTEHTESWFAPKPWKTQVLEQDLRPGGRSLIKMSGPEGELEPMEGVFLEVVPNRRIVSTDAFAAGWRPAKPFMVSITTFEPEGDGTRYTATARHWDEESMKQHEAMGFHQGWGMVAQQLAEVAESLRQSA
jgi:uncharacterized protein YndB with AHSA1/START domain